MSAVAARRLYIVAYCTLAAALLWLIVSVVVSSELEQTNPRLALSWRPHDPPALVQLSQTSLDAGKPADARSYALEAIARRPHDATAWRLLGQAALAASNQTLGEQLLAQAGKLTHRDATLAAWFFEDSVRRRRYADAVQYADIIMRRAPDKESAMVFRLAALAQDDDAIPALAKALQRNPAWREAFFKELSSSSANSAAAGALMQQMAADGAPLAPAEVSGLLIRMVRDGRAQEAHQLWLTSLPPPARPSGLVFDPTFIGTPAAAPFGWSLNDEIDSELHMPEPGQPRGLHIVFHGGEGQRLVTQTLVLSPGRYRFEAAGHLLEGEEELVRWQLGCKGQPPLLLVLLKGALASGSVEFQVSPDCPSPILALTTLPRESDRPASAVIERAALEKVG